MIRYCSQCGSTNKFLNSQAVSRCCDAHVLTEPPYLLCEEAAHVTPEILDLAEMESDLLYPEPSPISWEDVLYRMDGTQLSTGHILDMGQGMNSPAIRKIRREINKRRREG